MLNKILLICNDSEKDTLLQEIKTQNPITKIVVVNTMQKAIEKILNNGFQATIIDVDDPSFNSLVKTKDIVKLNYLTGKQVIILTDKISKWKKTCKKVFKSNKERFTVCNKSKMLDVIENTSDDVSHTEIHKNVIIDINKEIKRKAKNKSLFSIFSFI